MKQTKPVQKPPQPAALPPAMPTAAAPPDTVPAAAAFAQEMTLVKLLVHEELRDHPIEPGAKLPVKEAQAVLPAAAYTPPAAADAVLSATAPPLRDTCGGYDPPVVSAACHTAAPVQRLSVGGAITASPAAVLCPPPPLAPPVGGYASAAAPAAVLPPARCCKPLPPFRRRHQTR